MPQFEVPLVLRFDAGDEKEADNALDNFLQSPLLTDLLTDPAGAFNGELFNDAPPEEVGD